MLLAARDLRVRYRGSVLGVFWSLGHPLVLAAVYTIAFQDVLRVEIPHYPLVLLAALVPWMFFSGAVTTAAGSVVGQAHLVKKVVFPRETLPLAAVVAQLAHFSLAYLIVVGALALLGGRLGPAFLLAPVVLALFAVFAAGCALVASALVVYFPDGRHLIEVVLPIWFWVTPVAYPLDLVPARFHGAVFANPLTSFVQTFRGLVIDGRTPPAVMFAAMVALAAASFGLGLLFFLRRQPRFAEYV